MKSKKECIKKYHNCTQTGQRGGLDCRSLGQCGEACAGTGPSGAGRHSRGGWGSPPSHSQRDRDGPWDGSGLLFWAVAAKRGAARLGFSQKWCGTCREGRLPFSI